MLESQIIANNSDIIKKLPKQLHENFIIKLINKNCNSNSNLLLETSMKHGAYYSSGIYMKEM